MRNYGYQRSRILNPLRKITQKCIRGKMRTIQSAYSPTNYPVHLYFLDFRLCLLDGSHLLKNNPTTFKGFQPMVVE